MNLSRLVPFCFLAIGFCAPICSAQANRAASVPTKLPLTISVRELSIPVAAGRAFDRGTQLLAAKVWAGSISEFRKAIKAFPTFYEAFYNMGIAEQRLGRATEAESAFRKSLELSSNRYARALRSGPDARNREGIRRSGKHGAERPGDRIPRTAAGIMRWHWIRYTTDRFPAAESSAREALLREPSMAAAYVLLARVHLRESKPDAVEQDLDAYLKLDPGGVKDATVLALRTQAEQIRSYEIGPPKHLKQP